MLSCFHNLCLYANFVLGYLIYPFASDNYPALFFTCFCLYWFRIRTQQIPGLVGVGQVTQLAVVVDVVAWIGVVDAVVPTNSVVVVSR